MSDKSQPLKPTKNPLSSFAFSPIGVSFETQDDKEEVVLLLRQHWITNVGWVVAAIFLFIFPLLLPGLVSMGDVDFWSKFSLRSREIFLAIWYLLALGFVFERFLGWYYNVYIVTNERIVDVDFRGILYKNISEAPLSKVQDLTHRVAGFLPVIFDYGDLIVQTAAEVTDLEFNNVPHPSEIHKIIGDLIQGENREWKDV